MRACVDAERRAARTPEEARAFREKLRAQFERVPDVSKAMLSQDPEIVASLSDPMVLAALKDAIQMGDAELEQKYGGNEKLMRVVKKMLGAGKPPGEGA